MQTFLLLLPLLGLPAPGLAAQTRDQARMGFNWPHAYQLAGYYPAQEGGGFTGQEVVGQVWTGQMARGGGLAPREPDPQALELTAQERLWLKAHPVVRVGIARDFAPYEWIDEHGRYVGPVAEYMALLEKKLGVRLQIVRDRPWAEILAMAKNGELDMLSCVNQTPERTQFLSFSEPYKSTHMVIIDNGQGSYIGSLDQLNGKRVAVEKDYFMQELMEKNHPQIQVLAAESTAKALDLVVSGGADAYVGDAGTANYFIRKGALFSLRFSGQTEYDAQYRIAFSKNSPELESIVAKTMASIPKDEAEGIFNRWLGLKIEQGIQARALVKYLIGIAILFLLFGYWLIRLKREVAKRKQLEAALLGHNQRQKTILDNLFAYVALLAPDGTIQEVNDAPLARGGYRREDIIGRKFYDAPWWSYDAKVRGRLLEAIVKARQGTASRYDEFVKMGTELVPIDFLMSPIFDADGQVVGLLPSAVEITERVRILDALRLSEERYRSLFELTRDALIIFTPDTRCLDANPAAIELFDCEDLGELMRQTPITVSPEFQPDGRRSDDKIADMIRLAYENGTHLFEWTHKRKDGSEFPVEVLVTRLSIGGETLFMSNSRDISKRKEIEDTLAKSERHLRAILNSTAECVKLVARDGTLLSINSAGQTMLEADPAEQFAPQSVYPFIAPEYRAEYQRFNERVCDGAAGTLQYEIIGFRGTRRWMETHATPFESKERGERVQLAFTQDISYRKEAENKLRLAANVFTHAREGILIADAEGNIVDTNDMFTQISGYARSEVVGHNLRLLESSLQSPDFYAAMWQSFSAKGHWHGELWNKRKDGERYAALLTASAIRDAMGKTEHYVVLFSDITPLKHHQQQLEYSAHYDALTGLPNRVLLSDRLQHAIIQSQRRGLPGAVAYIDLDGFKAVNDTHGHKIGDELLVAVSLRMKNMLRESDTLSRIGGDEFIAVLADLDHPHDYIPVVERLLAAASHSITAMGLMIKVSASVGITLFPEHGTDADQLIRHADQAMYQAKQKGKNRYCLFDAGELAQAMTQNETLQRICQALDRREFVLRYLPKVNMKTGEVTGVEALLRWQHPEQGLLCPDEFLPLIDNHPISVELGDWVIDTALGQMSQWRADGLAIPISVNVGAKQIEQHAFVSRLAALLAAHPDVPPGCLELEVLETSSVQDLARISQIIKACHHLGVRFALDDFGTGFSSLAYLKYLPAESLKIDQSFVRGMLDNPDDFAIVAGIISLSQAFHRNVVAEGVETPEHGLLLLRLGCQQAQGFAISHPLPAEQIPDWARSYRAHPRWLDYAQGERGETGAGMGKVQRVHPGVRH